MKFKLITNGIQTNSARTMRDLIEQIIDTKILCVEVAPENSNHFVLTTTDCFGRNTKKLLKDTLEKIDKKLDERFRYSRKNCSMRYKLFVDGEYKSCYPTLLDFLINIRDTHVIYIEIHGTQIWMETAKKYGTYKKTMEFAQHGLNMHIEEVKERLMKDFETHGKKHKK